MTSEDLPVAAESSELAMASIKLEYTISPN